MMGNEVKKNLELWNNVYKTDPAYTKTGKVDGRQQTSITPMYLIKKATEQFGKPGQGWGYEVKVDRFDQGAPVLKKDDKGADTEIVLYHNVMHTILIDFWYMADGEKHTISQYGHTPFIRQSKYGAMTDFEAPKKSLTDAMKKAMSLLGFGGDVFMGMYEDNSYVDALAVESKIEHAENRDAEMQAQYLLLMTEIDRIKEQMLDSVNMNMLGGLYGAARTKLERRGFTNEGEELKGLDAAYFEAEKKIKEKANA